VSCEGPLDVDPVLLGKHPVQVLGGGPVRLPRRSTCSSVSCRDTAGSRSSSCAAVLGPMTGDVTPRWCSSPRDGDLGNGRAVVASDVAGGVGDAEVRLRRAAMQRFLHLVGGVTKTAARYRNLTAPELSGQEPAAQRCLRHDLRRRDALPVLREPPDTAAGGPYE
jgi:hypothetical protein